MLSGREVEKLDQVLERLRIIRDGCIPNNKVPDEMMVLKMISLVREVLGEEFPPQKEDKN